MSTVTTDQDPIKSVRTPLLIAGVLLALAVLILVGWPVTSPIYLGIIVGISLLFDGVSLFMFGVAMKKG